MKVVIAGLIGIACLALVLHGAAESNTLLIRDVTVHPVTAPPIEAGSVLVVDGKVAEIGKNITAAAGARTVDGHGLHLYPGLINAGATVGLEEIGAIRDTVDLDEIGLFNPQLRAVIAFNPSSEHIPVTRAAGITTVVSLPSDGEGGLAGSSSETSVITGQAALMHLDGWTWEDMALKQSVAMDMIFPQIQKVSPETASFLGIPSRKYPDLEREYKERLKQMSEFFEQARRYERAKKVARPDFRTDVKLEAMIPVIDGKQPVIVRAAKERAIKDAVEFADKEKVKIIIAQPVELGGTGPLLKAHQTPVILGETLSLPVRDDDPYDSRYTLPNEFYKAGVKICFATFDVQFARNVGFQAAASAGYGLPAEEALKGVTINAAEILGVADQIGSIEKGKLADLILTDGDPLEARTSIKQMFINGREVSLESRHTREYEKWMSRP